MFNGCYENDTPEQPFTSHVRARLAAAGLRQLDMTDPVRHAAGTRLYLDGTHLNAAGHHLYGMAIADALVALDKPAG